MTLKRVLAQFCLLITLPVQAQELIQLSENDISLLGIVTSQVMPGDDSAGANFPATVINSPLSTSSVTIPYSGIVQSWHITPGTLVNAGDSLIDIQSRELLDLQNNWNSAQLDLEQKSFELEKDSLLLQEGIISRQRLMQTTRSFEQAAANLETLKTKLSLAGFSEEQLNTMTGSDLGVYTVRSPVTGSANHLMVSAGTYVSANSVIASIDSEERWLSALLPARIASQMEIGQILRVAGASVPLTLRQKDYAIDSETQTVEIFAAFSSMPDLMVGQIVTLIIPPLESGLLIPASAVVHSGNETTVYVRHADGFESRPLNLLPAGSDYLALEGITADELIAIRGATLLKGMQLGLGGE
jgi:RND family efflux transporter MFP subunit